MKLDSNQYRKINKNKSWFFEKITKIDKHLYLSAFTRENRYNTRHTDVKETRLAYNGQPQGPMRKHAEGVYTLEAKGFNPRSGVHPSVLCKSTPAGRWVCDRMPKAL